jgi:hypothetical protein
MAVSTHLSRYVGPTEVVRKHGKTYIYDAGAGDIVAELSAEAADMVRDHTPGTLTYDGAGHITKTED